MTYLPSKSLPAHYLFIAKYLYKDTCIGVIKKNDQIFCNFICNANYLINEGLYTFKLYDSPHFKRKVFLLNVPQHDGIEVHPADYASELKGCFAPGSIYSRNAKSTDLLSKLFADSNSSAWLNALIQDAQMSGINHIFFSIDNAVKVGVTGCL